MIGFKDLENKYKLKTVKSNIAIDKEQALEYARKTRYPVVLKIESPDILHKSDIGAVKLNIKDHKNLGNAYDEIMATVNKNYPDAKIEGISVQEMLPEGFEVIIGYTNDRIFGPCMMVGMGGIFTEAFQDITFRALPFTKRDVESMVEELSFADLLLKGFRHLAKVPVELISEVIFKASSIGWDNKELIDSFDINPAIFYGDDYRIVDFKFTLRDGKEKISSNSPDITDIDKFFNATSVAIVGSSPLEERLGHTITKNLIVNGYKGRVYPVNPKYGEILGLRSYPDLVSIEEKVELAVVLISLERVVDLLIQCSEKGIKNMIIISAGGKEVGNVDLENEIKDTAKRYGVRIIGCNCLGVYDSRTKLDTLFFPYEKLKRPGHGSICLMSQSGTVGLVALDLIANLSKFTSYGNRIDVDEADLMRYFSTCRDTRVISAYIEGLLDGRKFFETVKSITPQIPVVVYKAGRTELASKASASHTGFLAGTHHMIEGLLKQAGVYQVDSFEALLAASKSLSTFNRVKSNKTILITNGAGVTIQAIDRIESKRILKLVTLSEDFENKLRELFASHITISNTIDLTGSGTESDFEEVINICCADQKIDIIMVYAVLQLNIMTEKMMSIIARYAPIKPVIFCTAGAEHTKKMKAILEDMGVPAFSSVEEWVSAAEALVY